MQTMWVLLAAISLLIFVAVRGQILNINESFDDSTKKEHTVQFNDIPENGTQLDIFKKVRMIAKVSLASTVTFIGSAFIVAVMTLMCIFVCKYILNACKSIWAACCSNKRRRERSISDNRGNLDIIAKVQTPLIQKGIPQNGSKTLVTIDNMHKCFKDAVLDNKLDKEFSAAEKYVTYEEIRDTRKLKPYLAHTDYIKAGDFDKAFIVMRDPEEGFIYDFWRMILVESVQHIITTANIELVGKGKIFCYWPNVNRNHQGISIKDITVTAVEEKFHCNFAKRIFRIKLRSVEHTVTQHHFLNWPGQGVTIYPYDLLPFVKNIVEIPYSQDHPILVHCSSAVDRSGAIILIHMCLRNALATQQIDIFQGLNDLRQQNSALLRSIHQYKLVHLVVIEYFSPIKSAYSCAEYSSEFGNFKPEMFERILNYINDTDWYESALDDTAFISLRIDKTKNRQSDIYPNQYGILYLIPKAEGDSCYINAVYVDGFNEYKKFIATQHPLENTVEDFWRLVLGEAVNLVVSLQASYDVKFWTNAGDFTSGDITVKHRKHVGNGLEHRLDILLQGVKRKTIQLIELGGWNIGENVPSDPFSLFSLWKYMRDMSHQDSKIVYLCRNGTTACGLFVALSNVLDQIEKEQIVDVCRAVRTVRRSRWQFVRSIEQIEALYVLSDFGNLEIQKLKIRFKNK